MPPTHTHTGQTRSLPGTQAEARAGFCLPLCCLQAPAYFRLKFLCMFVFFFPFSKLHKARDAEHIGVRRANPHPNAGSGREPCQSLRVVGSTQNHCSSNCQAT